MAITSLELDNLNLFNLNDEESASVNGGLVGAIVGALGVSIPVANEGLTNPRSKARDILIRQIGSIGLAGAIGALGTVALTIVTGGTVTATAASLGKPKG